MFLSAAHFYPQDPRWRKVGPMNYSVTVAAILASAAHQRGSTEFDKAAVSGQTCQEETNLVASHAVLLHLLKFALQLSLSLHLLLGAADIHKLAVHLLPVHLIYRLKKAWNRVKFVNIFWRIRCLLFLLKEIKRGSPFGHPRVFQS